MYRRVDASGRDRPCSQLRSVPGGKPNFVANCAWLRPIFVRTFLTSTSGTCTSVTRTLVFSPRDHAIACSRPSMIFGPTVDRLFAARAVAFFANRMVLLFVFIAASLFFYRISRNQGLNQPFHRVALGLA